MNLNELRKMAERYWKEAYHEDMSGLGEARVVTGNARNDLFFHRMLAEHGVEMILKQEHKPTGGVQWRLTDFKVADKEKYMMFLLRWS